MLKLVGHRRAIRAVAYAPGPVPLLASAGDDREVRLWDPLAGQEVKLLGNRREVRRLAFGPDGTALAALGQASLAVYRRGQTWELEQRWSIYGTAVSVAFSSDGEAVLGGLRNATYGDQSGRLCRWNPRPPREELGLAWHGTIWSAAFSPPRNLFAVGRLDRFVELWEVGRPQNEPFCQLPNRINALAFSADGGLLALASGKAVQVWDVDQGEWRCLCKGHRADVGALAFSPDGSQLLSGGADSSVRLWEVTSGRELAAWDWKVGQIHAAAFAPDGMTAACGGDRPTLVVWDIDEG